MKINLPIEVQNIIQTLQSNNYKAYVVGGCVRDSLLNIVPKDWDITTDCLPEEVMEIFKDFNVIPTGLKHGTITVMINKTPFEITTFRNDGKYSDGRHPDSVQFTTNLKDDLSRRDFTINAIAYNNEEGIIDLFNSINDINNKIIRCVGNPDDRFNEDALRMMRACRFASQLSFKLDEKIIVSIIKNNFLIKIISKERIQSELNKILISGNLNGLYHIVQNGLLEYVIPELINCFNCEQNNPYHIYNVGVHILKAIDFIEKELHLKLTMLFHDIAKPLCKSIDGNNIDHFYSHGIISSNIATKVLKRLRYDSNTIMKVRDLVLYHDAEISDTKKSIKKWLNKIGEDNFRDLLKVREADIKAQSPKYYQERHDKLERIKTIFEEALNAKECFSKKDLALNGTDLIDMGYSEGKSLGEIINKLVEIVIENPELNTKKQLIEIIKAFK